jgi:hypothetical protein
MRDTPQAREAEKKRRALARHAAAEARRTAKKAAQVAAANGGHRCPEPGCHEVLPTAKGLGTHRRTHVQVICVCGLVTNAAGIGPHRRACKGPAA